MSASLYRSKLLGWLHPLLTSPRFNKVRSGFEKGVDFLFVIEPLWVAMAAMLVFSSYLLQMKAFLPWIGLAMAFLPFPLRRMRQGSLRLRTSFDLPIAFLIAGALVGLIVSPDRSLSLGAFQCILAVSLFYYSWVNYLHLATFMKWGILLGLLAVLLAVLLAGFISLEIKPINSWVSGFGKGSFHGVALSLVIVVMIFIGMAIFGRDTKIRVASGFICLFFGIAAIFFTEESWLRLFEWASIRERVPLWQDTISMLRDSPFSGLGLGGWALAYNKGEVVSFPTHVHNAYLELYANTGILGMLAFVFSLVIAFKLALDIIRASRLHPWYGFGIGVVLAYLATLIIGIVESAPIGVSCVVRCVGMNANCYRYIVSPLPWLLAGFLVSAHRLLSKKAE